MGVLTSVSSELLTQAIGIKAMSQQAIVYKISDGIIRFTMKANDVVCIESYVLYEDGTVSYGYADVRIPGFIAPETSDDALELLSEYSHCGWSVCEYPEDMDYRLEFENDAQIVETYLIMSF